MSVGFAYIKAMKSKRGKTGYRGVTASGDRFQAYIKIGSTIMSLGVYDTVAEAAEVYDAYDLKFNKMPELYYGPSGKFQGVSWDQRHNTYRARCKGKYLGTFASSVLAAIAVNRYLAGIDEQSRNDIEIKDIIELRRLEIERQQQLKEYEDVRSLKSLTKSQRTPTKIQSKRGPEYVIQQAIIRYLRDRGWYVKVMHGSLYQSGIPDLYATHKKYGPRWIEVKNPVNYHFTAAQYKEFPQMISNGSPIFILCAANNDNYKRLFQKSNLWIYMEKLNYGK